MRTQFIPAIIGIGITSSLTSIFAPPATALSSAASITDRVVLIKTKSGQGSGVIINHTGNTYTILTAAHVVNDLRSSPLEITTPDFQKHKTTPSEVTIAPNLLDLATISFQSDRRYLVAELGDSQLISKGQPIFAAGFQGKSLKFHSGNVVAISRQSQDMGYGLAIGTADILPGMSGGGLFNAAGTLIGINGKSVGAMPDSSSAKSISTNQAETSNSIKPVSGLAIPINTFKQVASNLNVDIGRQLPPSGVVELTADDFFITAGNKSQKGNYRGAIADYDRALAMNPQFGEVYFRRGIARSLIKDWRGADADYTQAIAIAPSYTDAYLHRASVRNTLNDWRGAKADFDVVLSLNPTNLPAYIGRGVALCELNDCENGMKDYSRAIAIDPTSADAHNRRGFSYYRLGNRQGAIDNYLAAAELYRQQGKDRDYLETVQKIKQLVRG
jgi:tetratricopeptide (TPR) repeat protein